MAWPGRSGKMPQYALRRSGKVPQYRCEIGDKINLRAINDVSQRDDGFGIARDVKFAREEKGIPIYPPLDKVDQGP